MEAIEGLFFRKLTVGEGFGESSLVGSSTSKVCVGWLLVGISHTVIIFFDDFLELRAPGYELELCRYYYELDESRYYYC